MFLSNGIQDKSIINEINTMTIKEYFMDSESITYSEIIDYVERLYLNGDCHFHLREITSDNMWKVEAYYINTKQGVRYTVIFNEDVLSPYRDYSQKEVETIVSDLTDYYQNLRNIIQA